MPRPIPVTRTRGYERPIAASSRATPSSEQQISAAALDPMARLGAPLRQSLQPGAAPLSVRGGVVGAARGGGSGLQAVLGRFPSLAEIRWLRTRAPGEIVSISLTSASRPPAGPK